ncbi:MAG: GIY-YIG nuclease family protein [Gammaproteobacteria bacterium]|nr:GIY-YIG nuclease family protein [Gammaproteobacteria bacterium]
MNNWFVYIIRCVNNSLYTGITTDTERRLQEHQGKDGRGAKYLKGKGPLTMVWQTAVNNRSMASKLEHQIKQLNKVNKERLIQGDVDILPPKYQALINN